MHTTSQTQAGFTLIELLLYVGLVAIVMSGIVLFGWDVLYARVKSTTQRTVTHDARLASRRILHEVRNASDINAVSGSELCLASADGDYNPTRFYLSSGQVRVAWGGGSSDCTGMSNDQPLTSGQVTVTELTFSDLSSDGSQGVQFLLTVESIADRVEYQESQTFRGAAEVRSP